VSATLRARIKHLLWRFIVISTSSLLILTLLAYAADYAIFRRRVLNNRQPFSQITVSSYDAVQQKSGKTQFIFNPPQAQTCANALFPRDGFVPCWYLRRHSEQRTNI
jgi:hypothetical protein